MNPSYTVFIDVTLSKIITGDEVYMRLVTRLPYVPRAGDTIRLTDDNTQDPSTLDVKLDNVTYDVADGMFVCDLEDARMEEQYREDGTFGEAETVALYKSFGFQRLNYPQAEGRP